MTIPTIDIIEERWDRLSEDLREALYSDANSDLIWQVCGAEHISDDNTYVVTRLVGYVLMGFLDQNALSGEIVDAISIDRRAADVMVQMFQEKIFAPLRQQINSVYMPVTRVSLGPKIISDIDQPRPIAAASAIAATVSSSILKPMTPVPLPVNAATAKDATTANKPANAPAAKAPAPMFSATTGASGGTGLSVGSTVSANNNGAAPAPKPKQTSDIGWSKAQAPVVRLGVITPSIPNPTQKASPAQTATPTPSISQQSQSAGQKPKIMSEFERLDIMSKPQAPTTPMPTPKPAAPAPIAVTPSAIPTPPTPPAPPKTDTPPPVMLHQTTPLQSIQSTSSTRFSVGVASHDQLTASTPVKTAAPRPAVIEFGKTGGSTAQPVPPTQSNVVHYSQYDSGKPPAPPTMSDGPRQRVEITAQSAPKPAPTNTNGSAPANQQSFVPMPPKPPTPPTLDSNGKPKVIVQNYR